MYTLDKKVRELAAQYNLVTYGMDLDNGVVSSEDLGVYLEDVLSTNIDIGAYLELEEEEEDLCY